MTGAALAYKCMEVAYLRVVYSSHYGASRDRHELQTALQIVPIGNDIYDITIIQMSLKLFTAIFLLRVYFHAGVLAAVAIMIF